MLKRYSFPPDFAKQWTLFVGVGFGIHKQAGDDDIVFQQKYQNDLQRSFAFYAGTNRARRFL